MDNLDKFFLLIGAISLPILLTQILRGNLVVARAKRGNSPKFLEIFPASAAQYSDFKEAQIKVNRFIDDLLEDKDSKLILTENEVNSLSSRGIQLNTCEPGTYITYKFVDGKILKYELEWPAYGVFDLYSLELREIKFRDFQDTLYEEVSLIEFNSRELNTDAKPAYELADSPFLNFIFNSVNIDAHDSPMVSNTIKRQKNSYVANKIQSIQISSEGLVLSTFASPISK